MSLDAVSMDVQGPSVHCMHSTPHVPSLPPSAPWKETATFRWLSHFEKASGWNSFKRSQPWLAGKFPRNSGLHGIVFFFNRWFSIAISDFGKIMAQEAMKSSNLPPPRLRGLQESVPSQARGCLCRGVFATVIHVSYNMKIHETDVHL